jgi:hypothetical protein
MKTTVLIIVALVCTDYDQNYFCYKTVVERSPEELKTMSTKEKMCDTFTLYSSQVYKPGQRLDINN